jgi:2',3'-cyclic-nucleotide 2'-phosphodiesterase (5'-nucleotidase family)
VVDTGGSLTGAQSGTGAQSDAFYGQVLGHIHYDAVNAGPGELLATPATLKDLTNSGTALVSANGGLQSSGAPADLLKPYVVREAGGVKVAFVGVTAGGAAAGSAQEIRTKTPAVDALRAVLPELHKQADLVVVLADLDQAEARALATAGLDVQVILGARSETSQKATLVGSTVVANAGGYGSYVDRLSLTIGADNRVVSYESEEQGLDPSIPDEPGVLKLRPGYSGQG